MCARIRRRVQVRAGSGEKPYSDLELVKELRLLDAAARKAEKVEPRAAGGGVGGRRLLFTWFLQ